MYDGELNSLKDAMRFKDKSNNEEYFSFYDIKILSKDLEIIIGIATRAIEILNLVDNIYKINIAKEIQKRK